MSKPKAFANWTPEKQEEWMEKAAEYARKYQAANKEKNRKYYQANKEEIADRVRRAKGESSFSRIAWGAAFCAFVISDISDGTSPAKATRKIADTHTRHKRILAESRLFTQSP